MSIRKTVAHLMRIVLVISMPLSIGFFLSGTGGCGKGIFPEVTATTTSSSTPIANAFLYSTNTTDGTVSAFTRNTSTGSLGFIAKQSAGAKNGPVGLAVTAANDLVYVANASDGNIYAYTINTSGVLGALTSLQTISSGGNAPKMIAIDQSDNFVYVTNSLSGSVTEFQIGTTDGKLTRLNSTVTGFLNPFAIVASPSAEFVYVADSNAGLIYTYSVANNGVLTQVGAGMPSNGNAQGNPGLMAIDPSNSFLFVDDMSTGQVSTFAIQSGVLIYQNTVNTGVSTLIGIGAANNGGGQGNNWVFTANKSGNFVLPFLRNNNILSAQSTIGVSSAPTGLTIDPAGAYAYTCNFGNGTIGLIGIANSQCSGRGNCFIKNFNSESPANQNAGTQFIATTHQ